MQRKLCIFRLSIFPRTLCKAMLASMTDDPTAAEHPAGTSEGRSANRSVTRLRDPRALRALAHPIRLSLVGVLRVEGPLTATRAAELLGESSASTSFHLRQLAKYGLVEEAGGGKGRERPWRATAMFTNLPDVAENPDLAVAAELLSSVIAERYFEDVMRWLEVRQAEPEEWQRVAQFGDTYLYLTPDELAALGEQTQQMMDRYIDRQTHPELRPAGARLVSYLHLAFPLLRPFGRLPGDGPTGETAAPGQTATPPEEAPPEGSAR
jgi:predicted transcriptional regulator